MLASIRKRSTGCIEPARLLGEVGHLLRPALTTVANVPRVFKARLFY
jgi:hypothetical protein